MSQVYAPSLFPVDGVAGALVPVKAGHVFRIMGGLIQPLDATVSEIQLLEDETELTGPINLDQAGAAGLTSFSLPTNVTVTRLDLGSDEVAATYGGYVSGVYIPV